MSADEDRAVRRLVAALAGWDGATGALGPARAHLAATCRIDIGSSAVAVRIVAGRVAAVEVGREAAHARCDFALRAPAAVWEAHWQGVPAPGDHDIFALAKAGRLAIEGDLYPLMAHLFFFKALAAAPREG
jgi:hypothetical protein